MTHSPEPARWAATLTGVHHQAQLARRRHPCLTHPRGLTGTVAVSHLAWVVNRPFRGVLEGHADLDELIVYDRAGKGDRSAGDQGSIWLVPEAAPAAGLT